MSQQNVNTAAPESKELSVLKVKTARLSKAKVEKVAVTEVEQALDNTR